MTPAKGVKAPWTFEGWRAVVTGGSSGIGRALARAFVEGGATTTILARDPTRLARVRDELQEVAGHEAAPDVSTHAADLANEEELAHACRIIESELGGVDVLVHSAGDWRAGPVDSAPVSVLDQLLRINLMAPVLLTQALMPHLERSRGQVVFINSSAARCGGEGADFYAVTKHALRSAAEGFRRRLGPLGIRVITVFPGRTATPMQAAIHEAEGRVYDQDRLLDPDHVAHIVCAALSLDRSAEVTDLFVRCSVPYEDERTSHPEPRPSLPQ